MKKRTDYTYVAYRTSRPGVLRAVHTRRKQTAPPDADGTHTVPVRKVYTYREGERIFSVALGRYIDRDTPTGRSVKAAVDRLLAEDTTTTR